MSAKLQSEFEQELRLAEEFQRAVLPAVPDIVYLRAEIVYKPYSIISGDVYDFLLNREGELGIFVGDATGHGIAAALMTMMVHIGLDGIRRDLPTDEYIRRMNQLLSARQTNISVTGVFFRVKPDGELTVTHAGHPPLIVIPADGSDPVQFFKGGCALGIFDDEPVPYEEEQYHLADGDRIIAYTDSVIERKNPAKQSFGTTNLLRFLGSSRNRTLAGTMEGLQQELEKFSEGSPCDDDLTIILFEYAGNNK